MSILKNQVRDWDDSRQQWLGAKFSLLHFYTFSLRLSWPRCETNGQEAIKKIYTREWVRRALLTQRAKSIVTISKNVFHQTLVFVIYMFSLTATRLLGSSQWPVAVCQCRPGPFSCSPQAAHLLRPHQAHAVPRRFSLDDLARMSDSHWLIRSTNISSFARTSHSVSQCAPEVFSICSLSFIWRFSSKSRTHGN